MILIHRQAVAAIGAALLWCGLALAQSTPWHTTLYLGSGQVWHKRIPLLIRNDTNVPLAGSPVAIPIGSGQGQANIAGVSIRGLRVCQDDGSELLYAIRTSSGQILRAGDVPTNGTLIIAAECPARSTRTCYVYFENAQAWPVPDMLESPAAPGLTVTAGTVELLRAGTAAHEQPWPASANHRITARLLNQADTPLSTLVCLDARSIASYFRARHRPPGLSLAPGDGAVVMLGDVALFQATIAPHTLESWPLYPASSASTEASYASLLNSRSNLVENPSFEDGDRSPSGWEGFAPGLDMGLERAGKFGQRCARIHVPAAATTSWVGWRQDVQVQPGSTYLLAAYVKCDQIANGAVQLYAHFRTRDGQLSRTNPMVSCGQPLSGTVDWTLLSGLFQVPPDARVFEIHLTTNATGTLWHDGVVLARVTPALAGPIQSRMDRTGPDLAVWPVNAIVKIFHHDVPPPTPVHARISAARSEKEPLQLAIRSRKPLSNLRISVGAPKNAAGATLSDTQVNVAGFVPIDYPTNYYQSALPSWHRKFPTQPAGSDGWSDLWPDPLLPTDTMSLEAEQTQAAWITFAVPKDAAPGDYDGVITLGQDGQALSRIPYTLHVWDFALDDQSHVKAIYDVRLGQQWKQPGKTDAQVWREMVEFMASHRICPDMVSPSPQFRYEDGTASADFTEFDRVASWYFDELHLPHAYTPQAFYAFGWGMPPSKAFGQEPYEGKRPFPGADRLRLRPQYKQAYQACLRLFWDHLKAKGWDRKFLLYICDEPFDHEPAIRQQMKALCEMIHEVDPSIPIYCSTWHHVPDWDGSITAWGIGHYGVVPAAKIAQIRSSGTKVLFTTDGHLCTDTPYCAFERLLPHYCFKYDVEGYEFWGATWLTYDPYQFGWHAYIHQTDAPGKSYFIRYPNGDGYFIYPGGPIAHAGPVSSIRLEQAREGVEDYEYLWTLRQRIEAARKAGKDVAQAASALEDAQKLITIPNAGGRHSTLVLPNPDQVFTIKESVARAIEGLR